MRLELWDIVWVLFVSAQATIVAYVYEPRWKALIMNLPISFTLATLAVGRDVDITNVVGLLVLLCFFHCVRLLRYRLKIPIILAIVISALGYCAAGAILARILPRTTAVFWVATALISVFAYYLYYITPHRAEPGHRSPLPIWLKLPIISAVILFLISVKSMLLGFVTVFPLMGVVTSYEARHSLWTICRQGPIIMLTIIPMMLVCRLVQSHLGLIPALLIGWVAFFVVLFLLTKSMWARDSQQLFTTMEEPVNS
jgi:hypothetical protein